MHHQSMNLQVMLIQILNLNQSAYGLIQLHE